jgi:hypothetical protein
MPSDGDGGAVLIAGFTTPLSDGVIREPSREWLVGDYQMLADRTTSI